MTPLTAVAFALVVSVPPVAPDGGLDDGATNGVYVAANTRLHPHSATDPDGGDGPHPCCLYVHSLTAPAVDVSGIDPAFLVESVPIMLAESGGNNAAQRTDMVQGRPYTSYCLLQILVDGATGPLIARMGGTVEQLRTDVAFCLAVGQEWKRLTDNGVPWRKWTTRGKYVPVPVVGTDAE